MATHQRRWRAGNYLAYGLTALPSAYPPSSRPKSTTRLWALWHRSLTRCLAPSLNPSPLAASLYGPGRSFTAAGRVTLRRGFSPSSSHANKSSGLKRITTRPILRKRQRPMSAPLLCRLENREQVLSPTYRGMDQANLEEPVATNKNDYKNLKNAIFTPVNDFERRDIAPHP